MVVVPVARRPGDVAGGNGLVGGKKGARMNSKYFIEENLKRINARSRWLRFLQHTSTLGVIITLLFLSLGAALIKGWSAHPLLVRALIVVLVVAAVLAWLIIGISILSSEPRRQWLAGLLERGQPQLLDRLNTMV